MICENSTQNTEVNEDAMPDCTSRGPSVTRASASLERPDAYQFPPLTRHFAHDDISQPHGEFSSHNDVDADFDVFPVLHDPCDPYFDAEVTRCCAVVGPEYSYEPFSLSSAGLFPYDVTDSFLCPQRILEPPSQTNAVDLPALSQKQTSVCTVHLSAHQIMDAWEDFICQLPAESFDTEIAPGIKYQKRVVVYKRSGPLYCCISLFAASGGAIAVVMCREDGCTVAFNEHVRAFVGYLTSQSPSERLVRADEELNWDVPLTFDHDSSDWSWIDDEALDLHLLVALADQGSSILPLKRKLEPRTEELILTASPCDASALCELLVKLDLVASAKSDKIVTALSQFFVRCGEFGQLQTLAVLNTLVPIAHETLKTLISAQASDLVRERLQMLAGLTTVEAVHVHIMYTSCMPPKCKLSCEVGHQGEGRSRDVHYLFDAQAEL